MACRQQKVLHHTTPLGGETAAVVLDHGRAIGMVTVSDLQQAVLRRQRLTNARR